LDPPATPLSEAEKPTLGPFLTRMCALFCASRAADGPVVLTLRDACRLINLATFQYVSAEAKKAMGGQSITRADLVRTFSPEGPPSSGRECFVLPMRGV